MKIQHLLIVLFFFVFSACEKEKDVVFSEDEKEEIKFELTGTHWVSPLVNFDDKINAMEVFDDQLILSYLYYNNGTFAYSGEFDGNKLSHHYQTLGNSFGFNRLKIIDDKLYMIGLAGRNCVYKYDETKSKGSRWSPFASTNTSFYDFVMLDGKRYGGTGIAPFLRVSSGSSYTGLSDEVTTSVHSLCVFDNSLIASGKFKDKDGKEISGVARWDGTNWNHLGDGLDGTVSNMIVFKGKLIAQGRFEKSGNKSVNNIAMWDGTTWEPLGEGLTGGVNSGGALYVYGDELIVGGEFEEAGGIYSPNIAKWNGSEWKGFPSGIPSMVGAIAVYKEKLYISNAAFTDYFLRLE